MNNPRWRANPFAWYFLSSSSTINLTFKPMKSLYLVAYILIIALLSCSKESEITDINDDESTYDLVFEPTTKYFELYDQPELETAINIKVVDTPLCQSFGLFPECKENKNITFEIRDNTTSVALSGHNNTYKVTGLESPTKALVHFETDIEKTSVFDKNGKRYLELLLKDHPHCENTKVLIYIGLTDQISNSDVMDFIVLIRGNLYNITIPDPDNI